MKKTITRPNRSPLAACLPSLLFTCLTASIIHAATYTWDGAPSITTTSTWGNAQNWVDDTVVFNTSSDLVFSDATWNTAKLNTFLGTAKTLRSVTYNDTWGDKVGRVRFNSTGGTGTGITPDTTVPVDLTLSSTTDIATVALTSGMTGVMVWGYAGGNPVSGNLILADPTVFDIQGTGTIEISTNITESISGGKTVTKNGPGTAIFSRTCSYTGDTIINAGTLRGVVTGDSASSEIILNGPTATFSTSVTISEGTWNCAALTAAVAGTLEFNFGAIAPSTTVSPLIVAGSADFSAATPQVSVLVNAGLAAGTYPLMSWGSTSGAAPTVVAVSTLGANTAARLSVSGSTLNLVIEASATHYWDGDDSTLGFATAAGTWAAPTLGTLTSGWSTSATGEAAVDGNSVTTAVADSLNLGTDTDGLAGGTITVSGNVSAGNVTIGSASGGSTFSGYSSAGNIQFGQSGQNVTFDTRNALITTLQTVLSGSANGSFTKSGPGILLILGDNSGWGSGSSFYLNQGQVRLGNVTSPSTNGANSLGGVGGFAVKLGDTSGANTASMLLNNSINLPNAIEVRSGSSGAKSITTAGGAVSPILSGAITANDVVTISNAGNGTLTVSGAITANQDTIITTTNTSGILSVTNAGNSVAGGKKVTFTNSTTATGNITDSALWSGAGDLIYNPAASSASTITISGQKTHTGGSRIAAFSASSSVMVIAESSTGPANAPTSGPFGTGTLSMGGTTGINGDIPEIRAATTEDITIANPLQIKSPHFVTIANEKSLIFTGNVITALNNNIITSDVGSTVPGKVVEFQGAISGALRGITKAGVGTVVLKGANTYTGSTIVSAGTLTLGASDVLANATDVLIGAGTLDVGAGFSDTVDTLDVTAAATINLGAGARLVFTSGTATWAGALTLTGTLDFSGGPTSSLNFGSSSGLTAAQLLAIFATGFTNFALDAEGDLTATAAGGYASWQAANFTAQTADLDHDLDGVRNGVEFFIGGNTNTTGFTALPGVTNTGGTLSVTWVKAADYAGVYGTHYVVETSATLANPWAPQAADPDPGFTVTFPSATEVKYTFPAGTKNFARLQVTGP